MFSSLLQEDFTNWKIKNILKSDTNYNIHGLHFWKVGRANKKKLIQTERISLCETINRQYYKESDVIGRQELSQIVIEKNTDEMGNREQL